MKKHSLLKMFCSLAGVSAVSFLAALPVSAIEFERVPVTSEFLAEGAFYADFNKDGVTDITYGPYVFYGPDFKKKEAYREVKSFQPEGYSDQFLCFTDDLNQDGWADIIQVPWPGTDGYWWQNPGKEGGEWKKFFISKEIGNESQVYVDIDGDGQKDLAFNRNGFMGFASFNANDMSAWKWHAVSEEDGKYQRYFHGIGAGDVNTDGQVDVIDSKGWYENPGKDAPNFEGVWTYHKFEFADRASTICVFDIDGDGLNDVVCSWDAHLYGLVWWKAVKAADGTMTFEKNEIQPIDPANAEEKVSFTQMHAIDYADINGDGLTDFVTGKRWWAHGPNGDKEANFPAVLYWYECRRENGKTYFVPHLIDDNSGVGTQITVGDINGDGKMDVLSGNKKGCTVFLQK
ncbi:MAG: VCBS repeat-containing protein [Planctomycetaceae bacterium]|nr:VCBS repeat-containing protein [Planctomycetaceae bacterium]